MMRAFVVGVLCLGVVGCGNFAKQDAAKCSSYGYAPGSAGYANCRLQLQQSRDQADAATRAAMAPMMMQRPVYVPPTQPAMIPPPVTTHCYRSGPSVNCTSY